jgi:CopG antitoxin of type II toxin-antitoxin system
MEENRLSTISKADSDEKIGEFWDSHDFTEFDTDAPDVHFEITCAVPVEIELFSEIEKQAHKRGVKVETLVNLWLQQKVAEERAA